MQGSALLVACGQAHIGASVFGNMILQDGAVAGVKLACLKFLAECQPNCIMQLSFLCRPSRVSLLHAVHE